MFTKTPRVWSEGTMFLNWTELHSSAIWCETVTILEIVGYTLMHSSLHPNADMGVNHQAKWLLVHSTENNFVVLIKFELS